MLKGEQVTADTTLYIPMDFVEGIGSINSENPRVSFDRAADFLLCLNGKYQSRLLVQERYDATRMNFNDQMGGADPFVEIPEKNSNIFMPVTMAVDNPVILASVPEVMLSSEEIRQLQALGAWETGFLVHGNADPSAEDYNSLADFCFGEGCVEIRIPWLLLNVADPIDMDIHEDYYDGNYGMVSGHMKTCYIGLGDGKETIALSSWRLEGVGYEVSYRERLKQSYDVVQEYWR